MKHPPINKAAKIYRKLDLPGDEDSGLDGRQIVENDIRLLMKADHPNILKV